MSASSTAPADASSSPPSPPPTSTSPPRVTDTINSYHNRTTNAIRTLGTTLFNSNNNHQPPPPSPQETPQSHHEPQKSKVERFIDSKPRNVVGGLARGLLSVGNGIVGGVSGLIVEPVRGAERDGVTGALRGVCSGVTGLVMRPVAGLVDLAGKTAQGIILTPGNLMEVIRDWDAGGIRAKSKKSNECMFGVPLDKSLEFANSRGIVHVTDACLIFLRDHVDTEGLFRISASAGVLEELQKKFDSGESVVFSEAVHSPHQAAGLLKLFLRELPDPLLTTKLFYPIIGLQGDTELSTEERLLQFKHLIQTIPNENQVLFFELLDFLGVVKDRELENKMSAQNLAVVFGPTVLRPEYPEEILKSPKDVRSPKLSKHNSILDIRGADIVFKEVQLSIAVICDMIKYPERVRPDAEADDDDVPTPPISPYQL